jgi:serine/threonine-protein kinase
VKASLFCGRYRVVRRLGTGGTATVFLAEDERLGRRVAVKRLHGAEVTDETAERLRREARIMASLRHPNLVTVYDMLTEDDDLFLVMEFVDGDTLAHVLDRGPLDPGRVVALLRPVAAALDHAHARGVVHRDVKPSNILVSAAGTVKLADLGLATAAEITRITPPGSIIGTPAYMAPEQARPGPCSGAVDVYALAAIAFQALCGRPARTGRTALAVLRQATTEPTPDLRDCRPETPAAAAEALSRAMALEPADRQPSATQLIDELEDAFAPVVREPLPATYRRDPVRRILPWLAAAALAATAVAVLLLLRADGGGGGTAERRAATPAPAPAQTTRTATPQASGTPRASPAPRASATPAAGGGAATPGAGSAPAAAPRGLSATGTVRAFYRRAAAKNFDGAWALAGPAMRAVFGNSEAEFRRQLSTLERIEFEELAVVERGDGSATVRLRTVATHANRVDRCSGTLRTVRSGGRWLVEPAGLSCQPG